MKYEDIYTLLNEIIFPDDRELDQSRFSESVLEKVQEKDRRLFILLKNISSLGVTYSDGEIVFGPAIEICGKGSSFDLQDMSENDYGNGGVARFFTCAVLELLSFTSKEYYMALRDSKMIGIEK